MCNNLLKKQPDNPCPYITLYIYIYIYYVHYMTVHTLNIRGGSLNMIIEKMKTNAGAVEKSAVTSVGGIVRSALV